MVDFTANSSSQTTGHQTIGIFGGTFDPIHFGHLRTALELKQLLELDEMRLVPCNAPAHRLAPGCSAEHRLHMLELAVEMEPELQVDDREVQRPGASYSVDTLSSLREEFGDQVSLCLVMGMDSFKTLPSWHQWEKIPQLAHLIVVERPGSALPGSELMHNFINARRVESMDELRQHSYGRLLLQQMTPLAISATQIRQLIRQGKSPRYLLPDPVWDYMQQHKLYREADKGPLTPKQ